MQERRNSIADALDLCLSCNNPSKFSVFCNGHSHSIIVLVVSNQNFHHYFFWHQLVQNYFTPDLGSSWEKLSMERGLWQCHKIGSLIHFKWLAIMKSTGGDNILQYFTEAQNNNLAIDRSTSRSSQSLVTRSQCPLHRSISVQCLRSRHLGCGCPWHRDIRSCLHACLHRWWWVHGRCPTCQQSPGNTVNLGSMGSQRGYGTGAVMHEPERQEEVWLKSSYNFIPNLRHDCGYLQCISTCINSSCAETRIFQHN